VEDVAIKAIASSTVVAGVTTVNTRTTADCKLGNVKFTDVSKADGELTNFTD